MKQLAESSEPVRDVAKIFTVVLVIVGAVATALSQQYDWSWLPGVVALVGVVSHWVGGEKVRGVVTPTPNVTALLNDVLKSTNFHASNKVVGDVGKVDALVEDAGKVSTVVSAVDPVVAPEVKDVNKVVAVADDVDSAVKAAGLQ